MGHVGLFFFILIFSTANSNLVVCIKLLMEGFKLQTSGIRSHRSDNWATTTFQG